MVMNSHADYAASFSSPPLGEDDDYSTSWAAQDTISLSPSFFFLFVLQDIFWNATEVSPMNANIDLSASKGNISHINTGC